MIEKLTTLANTAYEQHILYPFQNQVTYIHDEFENWMATYAADDPSTYTDDILRVAGSVILEDAGNSLISSLSSAVEAAHTQYSGMVEEMGTVASEELTEAVNAIRNKIISAINNCTDQLSAFKSSVKSRLEESIGKGAAELKSTLNSYVDGLSSSGGGTTLSGSDGMAEDSNSAVASLLAFRYSDYLRLFLLIGLYVDEEGAVLRIGDVIQADMGQKMGKGNDYRLSEASSYVRLSAKLQVKPTLLALPLFAKVEGNPATGTEWYTFEYTTVKGY